MRITKNGITLFFEYVPRFRTGLEAFRTLYFGLVLMRVQSGVIVFEAVTTQIVHCGSTTGWHEYKTV